MARFEFCFLLFELRQVGCIQLLVICKIAVLTVLFARLLLLWLPGSALLWLLWLWVSGSALFYWTPAPAEPADNFAIGVLLIARQVVPVQIAKSAFHGLLGRRINLLPVLMHLKTLLFVVLLVV